jgi:hypothetical protein
MGLSITLRTDRTVSHFRRNLLKLVKTPNTNRLILCSGYISEGQNYSVLQDDLLKAILASKCSEVITIAGMFISHPVWRNRYNDFVNALRDGLNGTGISLRCHSNRRGNWHAKIAMKLYDHQPVACIIGSSNLTTNAYGEGLARFNHEADVLMWRNEQWLNDYFEDREESWKVEAPDPLGPIGVVLDMKKSQPNEAERLSALYKLVMAQLE